MASRTLELIISLKNAASEQLKALQDLIGSQLPAAHQKQAQAAKQAAEESENAFVKVFNKVKEVSQQVASIGFEFYGIQNTVRQFQQAAELAFNAVLANGVKLQAQLLEIQSTLAATTQVKVAGNVVSDPLSSILALKQPVLNAIEEIRIKSLDISNATSDQLIDVFKLVTNSIGSIGGNLQDATKLGVAFSQGLTSLNIPLYQARQEVQSILNLSIDRNSVLARSLNLNNELLAQEKAKGNLIQFLLDKTAALAAGQTLLSKTFQGVTSNIAEIQERISEAAGKPILQPLTDQLNKIFELLKVNRQGLENFFQGITTVILQVSTQFSNAFTSLLPILSQITQLGVTIASAFGSTLSQSLTVFLSIIQGIGIVLSPLGGLIGLLNTDFGKFIVTLTTIGLTLNSVVIPAFLNLGRIALVALIDGLAVIATTGFPLIATGAATAANALNGLAASFGITTVAIGENRVAFAAFAATASGEALASIGSVVVSLGNSIRATLLPVVIELTQALGVALTRVAIAIAPVFAEASAALLVFGSRVATVAAESIGLSTALATRATTALATFTAATAEAAANAAALEIVLGGVVLILGAIAVAAVAYNAVSEISNDQLKQATDIANDYTVTAKNLTKTIEELKLKRKENGELTEADTKALSQAQEQGVKTSEQIQKQIERLEESKNGWFANKEAIDKLIVSQKKLLEGLASVDVLALPVQRLGTEYEQLAIKAKSAIDIIKSGAGDPGQFAKFAQTIAQITKEQFDAGLITQEQAKKNLDLLIGNTKVDVEIQRKAQKEITSIYEEETKRRIEGAKVAEKEAEIGRGDKSITQAKKAELDEQLDLIKNNYKQELDALNKQKAEIERVQIEAEENLQLKLALIRGRGNKTEREQKLELYKQQLEDVKKVEEIAAAEQETREKALLLGENKGKEGNAKKLAEIVQRGKDEAEARAKAKEAIEEKIRVAEGSANKSNAEAVVDAQNEQKNLKQKGEDALKALKEKFGLIDSTTDNKRRENEIGNQKLVTEDLDRQLKIRKDIQETAIKDIEVAVKLGQKTELEGIEATTIARRQQLVDELAITQRKYEATTVKDDAYAQGLLQKSKQLQDQITELSLKAENDRVAAKIRVLDRANQASLNQVKQNEQEQQTAILFLKEKGYKSDLDLARQVLQNKKEIIKEEIEAQRKVVEAKSVIFDKDPGRDEATRAQRQNELAQEKLKLGALGNQLIETQIGLEKNLSDQQARGIELQVKGYERQLQLNKSNTDLLLAQQDLVKSINSSQQAVAGLRLDQIKEAGDLVQKYQAGEFQNSQQRALVEKRISELGFSTGSTALDFARKQFTEKQNLLALQRTGFEAEQKAAQLALQAKQIERNIQFQITESQAQIALINAKGSKNQELVAEAEKVVSLIQAQKANLTQINQLENQSLETQQKSARTIFDAKESSEKFKDAMGIAGAEAANLGQATNGVANGLNNATTAAGQLTNQTQKAAEAMQDYGKGIDEATKKQIALANTANQVKAGTADQISIDLATKGSSLVNAGSRKVTNAELFTRGQDKSLPEEVRRQNRIAAEEIKLKDQESLETAQKKLAELRAQNTAGLTQLEINKKNLEQEKAGLEVDRLRQQVQDNSSAIIDTLEVSNNTFFQQFIRGKKLVQGFATGGVAEPESTFKVGEKGEELVQLLPRGGARIFNNSETREIQSSRPSNSQSQSRFGTVGSAIFSQAQVSSTIRRGNYQSDTPSNSQLQSPFSNNREITGRLDTLIGKMERPNLSITTSDDPTETASKVYRQSAARALAGAGI